MVRSDLVKYIQDYHSKGYSISSLKDFLINQGYDEKDVEEAINHAYTPEHHNKKLYIILGSVAGAILLVALLFLIFSGEDTAILDLTASSQLNTVESGNPYSFTVNIENVGDLENFPATLRYRVTKNGVVESSYSEVLNSEIGSKTYNLNLPPGNYNIEVSLSYEDKSNVETLSFEVVSVCGDGVCDENENCPEDCVNIVCGDGVCSEGENCPQDCNVCGDGICSEGEDCPEDCETSFCGDGTCDEDENYNTCLQDCPLPKARCGNNICEITETKASCPEDCETVTGINAMSGYEITKYIPGQVEKNGPEETANECDELNDLEKKDNCFFWIMRTSLSSFYCSFIENPNTRDNCYISYVYESNDFSVCSSIKDSFKRETCDALKRNYEVTSEY